jgi:DNA invertase Pin-like site-specific DNA recombinase
MQQKRGHVKQPRFMKWESACSFTSKDDSSTTAGKAMFQMLNVFAEFERGIIRERVNAGLARARANGTGRRRVEPAVEARILELKASGDGMLKIGRKLGIGTSVVQRVFKQEPRPS